MKFKQILSWIVGYEILSWLLIWMNSSPPAESFYSVPRPTFGQVVVTTHVYTLVLIIALAGIYWVVVKAWKASNHRRR